MLTQLDPKNTDWKNMPLGKMAFGNALDAFYTLEIYYILEEKLRELGLIKLYESLLSPITPILAKIEYKGLDVDEFAVDKAEEEMAVLLSETKALVYNIQEVKPEVKLKSPKDIVGVLFLNEDGFGFYPPFRTKKGAPATDKRTKETLVNQVEEELKRRK